jgi:hypothetical protein
MSDAAAQKPTGASLATRIFLGTAVVLLVALGAAVAVASILGERTAKRDARERIGASGAVQTASRSSASRASASPRSASPVFKAYLAEASRPAAQSISTSSKSGGRS